MTKRILESERLERMKRCKNGAHGERGQSLVEFALITPLLILIVMGVFDLGRAAYAYAVIASAAREGARYGTTDPTNSYAIASVAVANTTGLEFPKLAVSSQCVPDPADCTSESESQIQVTATYLFQPITAFWTSFPLSAQSRMAIE